MNILTFTLLQASALQEPGSLRVPVVARSGS